MDDGYTVVEEEIKALPANTQHQLQPVVDREEAVGGQGLAAMANLMFKKAFQSQRAMEAVECTEVKAMSLLALQQESLA
jgi:hypothetical protein